MQKFDHVILIIGKEPNNDPVKLRRMIAATSLSNGGTISLIADENRMNRADNFWIYLVNSGLFSTVNQVVFVRIFDPFSIRRAINAAINNSDGTICLNYPHNMNDVMKLAMIKLQGVVVTRFNKDRSIEVIL